MIKLFPLTILLLISLSPSVSLAQDNKLDAEEQVKNHVIQWADQVFLAHSSYKFEEFHSEETDDYFIQSSRIEMYEEKIASLKRDKAEGKYSGTAEQYEKDAKKYQAAADDAKKKLSSISAVEYYTINFWTNIMTSDGITVYYEIKIRLDAQFVILSAIENSSVGKKSANTKISYKKGATGLKVAEK